MKYLCLRSEKVSGDGPKIFRKRVWKFEKDIYAVAGTKTFGPLVQSQRDILYPALPAQLRMGRGASFGFLGRCPRRLSELSFFSGQAESASNGRARSDETDRLGDSPIQRCHGGIGNEKSMGKSAGNLRIHEFARKTAFAFGLGAELPFDGKERGGSGKALSGILAGHRKVRSREHSRFCPGLHPTPHGEGSEKGDAEQRQGIVSGVQGLCQTEGCEIGRDACGPFPDGAALRRRRFRQMARA